MATHEFDSWWAECFPGVAPAGLALRTALPSRWLRIHSLPNPKRYAESEAERAELLHRHRGASGAVLSEDSVCALVVGAFSEVPGPAPRQARELLPELEFQRALSAQPTWFRRDADDDLVASVAVLSWSFERLTRFLLQVADDQTGFSTFVSFETGEIYAPYDGGADLILATEARRNALRERWAGWVSKHPEGL